MSKNVPSIKQRREEVQKKKQAEQNRLIAIGGGVIAVLVLLIAVAYFVRRDDAGTTLEGERPLTTLEPAARNNFYAQSGPPAMTIDTTKNYEAVIQTNKGELRVQLFDDQSPITVNNFVYLATQGFYDGTIFHRVLPDFMAQAGDPTGTGTGGPGYQFEDETSNGLVFDRAGLLAMANSGLNTNGSQFFITLVATDWLDGAHTIFGELTGGQEILDSITFVDPRGELAPADAVPDTIEKIEIIEN